MTAGLRAGLRAEDPAGVGFEIQGAELHTVGLGIEAETGPSELYDYYNPDAAVKVKPVRFSNLEPATK